MHTCICPIVCERRFPSPLVIGKLVNWSAPCPWLKDCPNKSPAPLSIAELTPSLEF